MKFKLGEVVFYIVHVKLKLNNNDIDLIFYITTYKYMVASMPSLTLKQIFNNTCFTFTNTLTNSPILPNFHSFLRAVANCKQ